MSAPTRGLEKSPSQPPHHKAPTRFLSLSQRSHFHLVHLATVFCSFNWSAVAMQRIGAPAFLFIQLRDIPSHSLQSTDSIHKINKIKFFLQGITVPLFVLHYNLFLTSVESIELSHHILRRE